MKIKVVSSVAKICDLSKLKIKLVSEMAITVKGTELKPINIPKSTHLGAYDLKIRFLCIHKNLYLNIVDTY